MHLLIQYFAQTDNNIILLCWYFDTYSVTILCTCVTITNADEINCRAVTYTGWDNLQIQYFKGFCITFPPLNLPSHLFPIHCFRHPLGQWPVTLLHTSSSLQCPHGVLQSLPWYWSRHTEKRFTLYNRSSLILNKQTLRTIISENIFLWLSQYVFFFPFFLEYNFFSTFHIVCVLIVLYTWVFLILT